MRYTGHVARIEEERNTDRISVGISEGQKALRRPRRTWEDNIKVDLRRQIGWVGIYWIDLTHDRGQWGLL
jgi:hypothetical protein